MRTEDLEKVDEREADRVYRLAFVYLKNISDAEDAVTEVFIKYMTKAPDFREEEHEKAWFLKVTANYCKDQLKKKRAEPADLEFFSNVPAQEENRTVLEAVMELPQMYRELIYLYYYEGYTLREISKVIKIRESTLQSRLAEARKKIRLQLED